MTDACPICYESLTDRAVFTCPKCHHDVCESCTRAIRRSRKVPTACPLCRHDWKPQQLNRARADLQRWHRRAQMTRQLLEWLTMEAPVTHHAPAGSPAGYETAAAISQFILMGIWLWNTASE